jgi:hypothetical protein
MDTNFQKKIPVKHECKTWYFWLEIDLPEGRRKFISCAMPLPVHIEGFSFQEIKEKRAMRESLFAIDVPAGMSLREAIELAKKNGKGI